MADLKLISTDKTVQIDINAGWGGVHDITLTLPNSGVSKVVTEQELVDIVAPSVRASFTEPQGAA